MRESKLKILKLLMDRPMKIKELASELELSYSRAAAIVRELIKEKYCERQRGKVVLTASLKTGLLRYLAHQYNISSLLGGASENLLLALSESPDIKEIQKRTGLAQSTIHKTIRKLMAIGAVRKVGEHYILAEDERLREFLRVVEFERRLSAVETDATLLYSGNGVVLKRVSAGRKVKGSKTAFSLFPMYGIEYFSPYEYYFEPEKKISMEECFVHALMVAENKSECTMCAIFYLRNRDKMDLAKVKKLANRYGIISLFLDLQNYVKGLLPNGGEKFLPWDEFKEKASIYGIQLTLPPGYEKIITLLYKIGENLDKPIRAYLFGGANLLIRGLKNATKDLDIFVEDENTLYRLRDVLVGMGFKPMADYEITSEDRRLNPSMILTAPGLPRVDIFTRTACGALVLMDDMKESSERRVFGKLELHLLSLEDVFLLKSITEREGDLEDMSSIVRRAGLDWNLVLKRFLEEEALVRRHFCFIILDNLEILKRREGITIPIHKHILRHCVDVGILQSVSKGAKTIRDIRKELEFPEFAIRNRVARLVKKGMLSKQGDKRRFILSVTSAGKKVLFEE
ncbi:MAG: ArsR family transcriptional regulator [Candidatus Methanomethylicia archaeon]|jgi:predicted transcriptional regulator|nr:ArsR family transcriptional regulator [Candidatus Methanomethylicia archaeon]